MAKYEWKKNITASLPCSAAKAHAALKKLEEKHGFLLKEHVVEAARNPKHVLHKYFEWSNAIAAAQYRLSQAGELIRYIAVKVIISRDEEEEEQFVRAFFSVNTSKEGNDDETPLHVYKSVSVIMADDNLRTQTLHRALKEAEAWVEKYQHLDGLGKIVAAIEEAVNS